MSEDPKMVDTENTKNPEEVTKSYSLKETLKNTYDNIYGARKRQDTTMG